MCGINGIVTLKNEVQFNINQMLDKTSHRGPDNTEYIKIDNIILGHNRLSIHDLTTSGNQPMKSRSSKWVIVFNGEIYNYKKIIDKYNITTSSNSDTEVLVELIDAIGFDSAISECIGMFAVAAYNLDSQKLFLSRDRIGEKPLYYHLDNNSLLFSSELKSIITQVKPLVNENALRTYFFYSYIPETTCILEDTRKVLPGTYLEINTKTLEATEVTYWSLKKEFKTKRNTYKKSFNQAVSDLDKVLSEVIEEQLESDVPIGCFLSGGIDSSLIVSIASKVSQSKISTFSIGFNEDEFNEAEYAKQVANQLKTNHTELYATPEECLNIIESITNIYDEPFADSSQIPTTLLSRLTKKHVTVCLSGDGGDELFGGYTRYFRAERARRIFQKIPYPMRNIISKNTISINNTFLKDKKYSHRVQKLAQTINYKTENELYNHFISHWNKLPPPLEASTTPQYFKFKSGENFFEKMMLQDIETYLPSDIFTKVDRASMSNSLEVRAPLVDKRVLEFSLTLPFEYKVSKSEGKIILKELLAKYIDKKLIHRPKKGFGIPLNQWLRNELKEWANEILFSPNPYISKTQVQKMWNEHLSYKNDWGHHLWDIIIFNKWFNDYVIKTLK